MNFGEGKRTGHDRKEGEPKDANCGGDMTKKALV